MVIYYDMVKLANSLIHVLDSESRSKKVHELICELLSRNGCNEQTSITCSDASSMQFVSPGSLEAKVAPLHKTYDQAGILGVEGETVRIFFGAEVAQMARESLGNHGFEKVRTEETMAVGDKSRIPTIMKQMRGMDKGDGFGDKLSQTIACDPIMPQKLIPTAAAPKNGARPFPNTVAACVNNGRYVHPPERSDKPGFRPQIAIRYPDGYGNSIEFRLTQNQMSTWNSSHMTSLAATLHRSMFCEMEKSGVSLERLAEHAVWIVLDEKGPPPVQPLPDQQLEFLLTPKLALNIVRAVWHAQADGKSFPWLSQSIKDDINVKLNKWPRNADKCLSALGKLSSAAIVQWKIYFRAKYLNSYALVPYAGAGAEAGARTDDATGSTPHLPAPLGSYLPPAFRVEDAKELLEKCAAKEAELADARYQVEEAVRLLDTLKQKESITKARDAVIKTKVNEDMAAAQHEYDQGKADLAKKRKAQLEKVERTFKEREGELAADLKRKIEGYESRLENDTTLADYKQLEEQASKRQKAHCDQYGAKIRAIPRMELQVDRLKQTINQRKAEAKRVVAIWERLDNAREIQHVFASMQTSEASASSNGHAASSSSGATAFDASLPAAHSPTGPVAAAVASSPVDVQTARILAGWRSS